MPNMPARASRTTTAIWLALLTIAVVGVSVALLVVVPGYKKTFDEYGVQLPWLTKTVLSLSVTIAAVGWVFVPVLVVAFCGVPVLLRHVARMPRLGTAFAAAGLALLLLLGTVCLLAIRMPMDALAAGLSK